MKKKILAIAMSVAMLSVSCMGFAEEFSDDADDMDYYYDEDYDEYGDYGDHAIDEPEVQSDYYNEDYYEDEPYNEYYEDYDYDDDYDSDEIRVYVNDRRVYFDVAPVVINNRTMVPMRAIFEALGADVDWDNDTQTAFGELDGITVEITIGDSYLYRNGRRVSLDSPAIAISGRTLVPVRAIAESFDCDVEWDGDNMIVDIYY